MSFWTNKKVLVTGRAGFLGSYVSRVVAHDTAIWIQQSLSTSAFCPGDALILNVSQFDKNQKM